MLVCYFCGCAKGGMGDLADHMRSKHTQERPVKCTKCSKTLVSLRFLRIHMECHSKYERVKCPQCPKSYQNNHTLQAHVRYGHGVQKYKCDHDKCNFKTATNYQLKNHWKIHEKNRVRNFVCEICKKGFFSHRELNLHLQIHSKDRKTFPCYFCSNVVYTGIRSLYLHLRLHTREVLVGGDRIKCKSCSAFCANYKEFREHVRREHEIERPHKCNLCDFQTDLQYHLKRHLATKHSNRRPFQCTICPATFNIPGSLKVHVKHVHFGLRDYSCNKCNKMFTTATVLKDHVQTMHSLIRPFPCTICGRGYVNKRLLNEHLKMKHGPKGYPCYFCSREFSTFKELSGHLYGHLKERHLKCDLNIEGKSCSFETCRKTSLNHHIRSVHEGYRLRCSFCSYKSPSKGGLFVHIKRMHTGERSIKCDKCGRQFIDRHELKKHACRPIDNLIIFGQKSKPIPCLICRSTRVTFRTEQNLRIHMEDYHPEKSFRCYFCSKQFNNKWMFESHIRMEHSKEKVKKCNKCDVRFFTGPELVRHRQTDMHRKLLRIEGKPGN